VLARLVAVGIRFLIRILTGARGLWQGNEPLDRRRVYYGNHSSHGDFVLIWSALPRPLRWKSRPVAGADYWNKDALRRYVIRAVFNGVLIERDAAKRTENAIDTLAAAVDGGASLILFPEGTRNPDESLLPFKSGIYHLGKARPDLEFVPVWLDNLRRVMPKGQLLPLPLLCTATFGPSIQVREDETKEAFLDRAREALVALAPEEFRAVFAGQKAAEQLAAGDES
jgi:1-acyl-sn-glycerol-3-phosphate acyltransferase